jgi:hypothetical protein
MNKVVTAAADGVLAGAEVIEVKDTIEEVVAPESGFPWGGVGIGVLIVAVVAIGTKILSD